MSLFYFYQKCPNCGIKKSAFWWMLHADSSVACPNCRRTAGIKMGWLRLPWLLLIPLFPFGILQVLSNHWRLDWWAAIVFIVAMLFIVTLPYMIFPLRNDLLEFEEQKTNVPISELSHENEPKNKKSIFLFFIRKALLPLILLIIIYILLL